MTIYTRFGTEVKLASSVNWNTGWVHVWRGMETKLYHISDLKADGGLNEIQAASDSFGSHLCRDCGKPMDVQAQAQRSGMPNLMIVTCFNKKCDLWSVTLTTTQYAALNEEQWEDYRTMVKGLKVRLGMDV